MTRSSKLSIRRSIIFAIVSLLMVAQATLAQDKAAKIDELVSAYHGNGQFNGTVLVAESGKVIYKKGFGPANVEWDISNQPDVKFRLGSITKQFTAVLILQLVEEGKVKLDGKLTDYLTDYRKDTGDKITIHHLLTHTSGIPSYTGLPGFMKDKSRDPYSVSDFVKTYCSGNLEFEPGAKYAYNNSGYFLLGAIIEKVTGKTYEQVLKEKILDPLGMKDTGYDLPAPIMKKRAAGYERRPAGLVNASYLDMTIPYAAGSLYSTVEDLYIWDQALYTEKVLSAKSKEMMFKPFLNNYAYGWIVAKRPVAEGDKPVSVVMHGGGINGFNTLIVRFVDDKHLIVLLSNVIGSRLNEVNNGIAAILYGKPYNMPKKPIADALIKTILEKGIAPAISEYRELKMHKASGYDFNEGELNRLGYQLLSMNKNKEAIEIFKLNVEAYPKSSNVYDSLGEAYAATGDKEQAIQSYKKALELNPQSTSAAEALKKLNAN